MVPGLELWPPHLGRTGRLPDRRDAGGLLTRSSHPYGACAGCGGRKTSSTPDDETPRPLVRRRAARRAPPRHLHRRRARPPRLPPARPHADRPQPLRRRLADGANRAARAASSGPRSLFPEEADLLSYHAYWSTHTRLAGLHPQLAVRTPSWREYADLAPEEIGRLRRMLVHGARRLRLPGRA